MLILGIDPGVQNIGLSIFNPLYSSISDAYMRLSSYNIDVVSKQRRDKYYVDLYSYIKEYLDNFECPVDEVAIEKPFFLASTLPNNIRTLEVIGIIKLACQSYMYQDIEVPISVYEYSPATIKKTVTGNGRADKHEVIKAINTKFNLGLDSSHIADASAVAYTHAIKMNYCKDFIVQGGDI